GITRRPAGFRGYAGAGFGGPHSGPRPTVLLKRADRGGQAAREPLGVLVVGRLDHDPHRWLGAARPHQYPARGAELRCRRGDRAARSLSTPGTFTSTCGYRVMTRTRPASVVP